MPDLFSIDAAGQGRFVARGDLGFGTARRALEAGVARLPAAGDCHFDLSGIDSADSAGLAVLIEWLSVARSRGVDLRFEGVPDQLLAIARISELDGLILGQPAD